MSLKRRRVVVAGDTATRRTAPMYDSSPLWAAGDIAGLRQRLDRDGYLLLRNVLPATDVNDARRHIVECVLRPEGFLSPAATVDRVQAADASVSPGLLARPDVARSAPVQAVLEHAQLYRLMDGLLGQPCQTVGYKWLRAVAHRQFTGVHTDRVYLGKGSQRVLTAWIPIGHVSVEEGSMMVAAGSHRARRFAGLREGYGKTSVGADGVESGWLSRDGDAVAEQWGFTWLTADFNPGDVCVIGLDVLHLSASNQTDR